MAVGFPAGPGIGQPVGSIPALGSVCVAQSVERQLPKLEAAGSIPATHSEENHADRR